MRTRSKAAIKSVRLIPKSRTRLASVLATLAKGEGFISSPLPGVKFMRSTLHVPRTPVIYDPSIVIIAQGVKLGHFGDRTFVYDADHYLALTVPLPFECETRGSPERPLLGLSIGVTPALVAELLMQIEETSLDSSAMPPAAESAEVDDELENAAVRLAESLRSRDDARILGPQIVREITYRVLRGKLGANLRALAVPHSHFGQISRVLHRIHRDYAKPYDIETLAKEAGMSVSTFHAHFRAVTSSSPLQYLKSTRLHKARLAMLNDGLSAAQAALAVGYESASQFSREFRRQFGASPLASVAQLRENMISLA